MNSKQRLATVWKGSKPDRIPFLPTILEHSAKIIGKSPSEVARSSQLIHEAQVNAFGIYGQDAVTVGIDIYNIEAEALGCKIKYHIDNSIPGVIEHTYEKGYKGEPLIFDANKGRTGLMLDAAELTAKDVGDKVNVGLSICGPFSICVELLGYENMIMGCSDEDASIHEIIRNALEYQKQYCDAILNRGIGITIFESWATPPLISPTVYREFVAPYEKELIKHIKSKGALTIPLVIGGDTSEIVDDIIRTGTTLVVADYLVDIHKYIDKAEQNGIMVRGNIDPKLVERGTKEEIIASVQFMLERTGGYAKFVLGTGVISYNTPFENILCIKRYLEEL